MKTDNIALTADGYVKLLDFGNSRDVRTCEILPHGNYFFEAPEVYRGEKAGLSSDLWSYGIVIALLLQEFHPFMKYGVTETDVTACAKSGNPDISGIKNLDARYMVCFILSRNFRDLVKRPSEMSYFEDVCKIPSFKPGRVRMSKLRAAKDDENGENDEKISKANDKKLQELALLIPIKI